jgi:plastocyanin domain-containing protein
MNARIPLLVLAAALATPAVAQHDHGAMKMNAPAASGAIAEGTVKDGVRTIELQVTSEGFVPAQAKVAKGQKTRLVITRKTDRTCATEIVVKDYGINTALPLNKAVTVELTPKGSGEIHYACAMGHIRGILFVP